MSETDVLAWMSRHPNEGYTRHQISEGSGQALAIVDNALTGTRQVQNGFVSDIPKEEWRHVIVMDDKWVWRDLSRLEDVVEKRVYHHSGVTRKDIIAYAKTRHGEPISVKEFQDHFASTGINRGAMNTGLVSAVRFDPMFRRAKRGEYQYGGRLNVVAKQDKTGPRQHAAFQPVIDYLQSHPDEYVTLDTLMYAHPTLHRGSISGAVTQGMNSGMPIERVKRGVYRWVSSGVVSKDATMTAYTEYAQITTGNITLFVGNGEVWEGTRLK